jgi:phosphate transport system permease protein
MKRVILTGYTLKAAVWLSALVTFAMLLFLVGYILAKGVPHIQPELFDWTYTSDNVSMMPALVNTVVMTFFALLFAVPLGLFTAIYLVEYSRNSGRIIALIRVSVQTLSGIPSIVYGLFGLLFFVTMLGWGYSIIAGAFTLAIMILPLIIRTGEEALLAVPVAFREGSFALGAGKLRTVFRIVLPSAVPGIMAGVILGIGRIVGETAALIYTSGTVAQVADGLGSSGRTLSVHMYVLSSEGFHPDQAYATAVVLLVLVVGINSVSAWLAKKVVKVK